MVWLRLNNPYGTIYVGMKQMVQYLLTHQFSDWWLKMKQDTVKEYQAKSFSCPGD